MPGETLTPAEEARAIDRASRTARRRAGRARRQAGRQLMTIALQALDLLQSYERHEYYATDYPTLGQSRQVSQLLAEALAVAEESGVGA